MQYDLAQAFVMRQNRRGKAFQLSPAVRDYINEKLDRERQQLEEQTLAKAREFVLREIRPASESGAPTEQQA